MTKQLQMRTMAALEYNTARGCSLVHAECGCGLQTAAEISKSAMDNSDQLAVEAVDLFLALIGAEAGHMGLRWHLHLWWHHAQGTLLAWLQACSAVFDACLVYIRGCIMTGHKGRWVASVCMGAMLCKPQLVIYVSEIECHEAYMAPCTLTCLSGFDMEMHACTSLSTY